MKRLRILPYLLHTVLLIAIGGCAYPISQEMRAKANPALTYSVAARDPLAHRGQIIIWGGIVVRVLNQPRQTVLTILDTPLDNRGVPMDEVYGRGRFIARVAEYLDPELYSEKKVILAGHIVGVETKPSGKTQSRYPVVQVSELHLLHEKDDYRSYRPYDYPNRDGYPRYDEPPLKGIQ
jgi:outer membrane lipoprotein